MSEKMPCSITDGPQYDDDPWPRFDDEFEREMDDMERDYLPAPRKPDLPDLRTPDLWRRGARLEQRRVMARWWLRRRPHASA